MSTLNLTLLAERGTANQAVEHLQDSRGGEEGATWTFSERKAFTTPEGGYRLAVVAEHHGSPPTSCAPSFLPSAPDDSRWFAEEVQPHERKLRSWLRLRFPSLCDIDDLVQESYTRLLRARATVPIGNPKSYLFRTAFNTAHDLIRRNKVIPFVQVGELTSLDVLNDSTDVAEDVSRSEEIQVLREAVQALPTRCRQVFTLRKLYGLSHREIAAKLGISEKTVEEQVSRGIKRCAAFLRGRGIS